MNERIIDITKDKFNQFQTVREDGSYNMFDPRARAMTDLTKDEWVTIMQEYEKLEKHWGKDES